MYNIILLVVYFVLTCSGLTFMKLGEAAPLKVGLSQGFTFSVGFKSLLGYILYIGSFLVYTKLITLFDISYLIPVTMGIVQILTVIIAITIIGEPLRATTIIGVGLVVAGITVMNLKVG